MLVASLVVLAIVVLIVLYYLFMSPSSQIFGKYSWKLKTNKKLIALTFDDGPNEPYTSQLLDTLNKYGIKATFFLVGKCVERYPDTARKIYESGHVVGNHSVSHEFHRYFERHFFENEIQTNQTIIKKYTNKTPALYRSPWLWRYPSLLKALRANGFTPVSGVFCHPLEVLKIDYRKIAGAAIKKAGPGSIIIFHDGKEGKGGDRSQSVKAVEIVVGKLLEQGYSFVTIDKLLDTPAYK